MRNPENKESKRQMIENRDRLYGDGEGMWSAKRREKKGEGEKGIKMLRRVSILIPLDE